MTTSHRAWLAGAAVLACSCSPPSLEPVTFQMDWTHDAEFAGLYAAQEQGYFREAGLAVELVPGPAGTDVPGLLGSGRADVAQMGMTMFLEARRTTPDFKAVMAVFQTSPRVLMTLKGRGIQGPRDLAGLRVGIKSPSWAAVVRKVVANAGADPARLVEVPVLAGEMDRFYRGEIDVWTGFANSEPVEAELAGHPTDLFFADDFGAGGYDGLIVVRASNVGDRTRRFIQAVARGWAWADAHGNEIPELMSRWDPERPPEFHRLAWQALRPLIVTGKNPIGWIETDRWTSDAEAFTNVLLERP